MASANGRNRAELQPEPEIVTVVRLIHYFFYAIESLRLLLSIVAMTTLQIVYSAASATLAGCHNLLNLDLASTEMVEINRDDDEANEIELTFF